MSIHVMSWVLRNSEARLGDRLVLLVYADHANDDGTSAWPAVETVARESRMSPRQVKRCIKNLTRDGEIADTGKRSKAGTKVYELPLYQAAQRGDNMSQVRLEGVTFNAPEGVTNPTGEVDRMSPEPSLKQPSELQPSEVLPAAPVYDPLKGQKIDGQDLVWNALAEFTHAVGEVHGSRMRSALATIRPLLWAHIEERYPYALEHAQKNPEGSERHLAEMVTWVCQWIDGDMPGLTWGPEGVARHTGRALAGSGSSVASIVDDVMRGAA